MPFPSPSDYQGGGTLSSFGLSVGLAVPLPKIGFPPDCAISSIFDKFFPLAHILFPPPSFSPATSRPSSPRPLCFFQKRIWLFDLVLPLNTSRVCYPHAPFLSLPGLRRVANSFLVCATPCASFSSVEPGFVPSHKPPKGMGCCKGHHQNRNLREAQDFLPVFVGVVFPHPVLLPFYQAIWNLIRLLVPPRGAFFCPWLFDLVVSDHFSFDLVQHLIAASRFSGQARSSQFLPPPVPDL